jgi:hypothetical protein
MEIQQRLIEMFQGEAVTLGERSEDFLRMPRVACANSQPARQSRQTGRSQFLGGALCGTLSASHPIAQIE